MAQTLLKKCKPLTVGKIKPSLIQQSGLALGKMAPYMKKSWGSSGSIVSMDWMTGRSGFDPRQGQRIFPLVSVSRLALRPTQLPVQRVSGVLSSEVSAARA
jgi:hypothetical protein